MLKAKIKEKLLNRRNEVDIDEIRDSNGKIIDLEGLINNPEIKGGYYIYDDENLKWVFYDSESLPVDYTGYFILLEPSIGDSIEFGYADEGDIVNKTAIGINYFIAKEGSSNALFNASGANKINPSGNNNLTVTDVYGLNSDGDLTKYPVLDTVPIGSILGFSTGSTRKLVRGSLPTYLYKHTINFDTDIDTGQTFTLITTSSENITSNSQLQNLEVVAVAGRVEYDGDHVNLLQYDKYNGILIGVTESNNIFSNLDIVTIISDTVTPL